MRNYTTIFSVIYLTSLTNLSFAENIIAEQTQAAVEDSRIFVKMPEQSRTYMRQDMLDHLVVLNDIIGLLNNNELSTVADMAENRMGRSSMGKYRGTGMGPGRFMPLEMRNIGWSMHDAATELADLAKKGDKTGAEKALQKVTTACVICHNSYRTR